MDLNKSFTQEQFGNLVGISQQSVSDMSKRGILTDGATAIVWLREYCGHLREVAAGRAAAGDLDLAGERAALARAQREKIELHLAERRGELAPVAAMEMVLANVGVRVGRILETIPAQIRRRAPGISAQVIQQISADIAKCQNMAASMTLADLEREDDDEQEEDEAD